jgi:hypothetical protein
MAYRDLITCVYVSDDAKSYLKRMDARYQSQNNGADPPVLLLGAIPATLAQVEELPNTPADLKPRTLLVRTADGAFVGRIPCFTAERYAAMTNGTAITFYDGQGVSHAGQVYGHEGERSNHKSNLTGRP